MIDRLPELHSMIGQDISQPQGGKQSEFLNHIKKAQSCLQLVVENNREMYTLRESFAKTTSGEQEARLHAQLRNIVGENNQQLNAVRDTVELLAPLIEKASKKPNEVENRMMVTMHATLVKQFQAALGESEKCQDEYNQAAKIKTTNQLRTMDPEVTDEVIESCIVNPHRAEEIIQAKMVGAHSMLIDKVRDIEDRLEDIKTLEENINILHKMFLDLAALVHQQGELLNSIENHVEKASDYIQKGNVELQKAKEHQKSTRWKKCCLLCILVVVVLVIVIPTISFTAA